MMIGMHCQPTRTKRSAASTMSQCKQAPFVDSQSLYACVCVNFAQSIMLPGTDARTSSSRSPPVPMMSRRTKGTRLRTDWVTSQLTLSLTLFEAHALTDRCAPSLVNRTFKFAREEGAVCGRGGGDGGDGGRVCVVVVVVFFGGTCGGKGLTGGGVGGGGGCSGFVAVSVSRSVRVLQTLHVNSVATHGDCALSTVNSDQRVHVLRVRKKKKKKRTG